MDLPEPILAFLDRLLNPEGLRSGMLVLIVLMVAISFWRSDA